MNRRSFGLGLASGVLALAGVKTVNAKKTLETTKPTFEHEFASDTFDHQLCCMSRRLNGSSGIYMGIAAFDALDAEIGAGQGNLKGIEIWRGRKINIDWTSRVDEIYMHNTSLGSRTELLRPYLSDNDYVWWLREYAYLTSFPEVCKRIRTGPISLDMWNSAYTSYTRLSEEMVASSLEYRPSRIQQDREQRRSDSEASRPSLFTQKYA